MVRGGECRGGMGRENGLREKETWLSEILKGTNRGMTSPETSRLRAQMGVKTEIYFF